MTKDANLNLRPTFEKWTKLLTFGTKGFGTPVPN